MDGVDRVIYNVAQREHKAIIENRKDKEAGVSWEEYRHNMTFTNMVIPIYTHISDNEIFTSLR